MFLDSVNESTFLDFTTISILLPSPITMLNIPLKKVDDDDIDGMNEFIAASSVIGSSIVKLALETILGINEAIAVLLPGTKFCIDALDTILGIVESIVLSNSGTVWPNNEALTIEGIVDEMLAPFNGVDWVKLALDSILGIVEDIEPLNSGTD